VNEESERIDLVYTWVDGAADGHAALRERHAANTHDRNPNRYRDNLDLLRYSLRSVERFAPWLGRVHVVTCRPQVPAWLDIDAPGLRVVHHDEFLAPELLPTFNAFAITANLHHIPELSQRFVYMADDYLLGRPVELGDFLTREEKIRVYVKLASANGARQVGDPRLSRWEAALAFSNKLLDERYGYARRGSAHHAPLFVDRKTFEQCAQQWESELKHTTSSRFRNPDNVAPRYLYPYYLLYESAGERVPAFACYRSVSYLGLDNLVPLQWLGLTWLRWRRTKFYCLNDNFEQSPSPTVEGMVRRFLNRLYPEPSRFERTGGD
jgi:hypothetical protein